MNHLSPTDAPGISYSGISRRTALRLGSLLAAGYTLTACGDSAPDNGSGETRRIFRFAQGAAPYSLDPAFDPVSPTYRVTAQILETLVSADHYTGVPQEALASSWTISPDGLTYTFTLREGVSFSDGTPLTAEAVLRNVQRWQALATSPETAARCVPFQPLYGWGFGNIVHSNSPHAGKASQEASSSPSAAATQTPSAQEDTDTPKADTPKTDEHTEQIPLRYAPLVSDVRVTDSKLVFTLVRPSQAFLRILTQPAFGVVSPEALTENHRIKEMPIGTGPFKISTPASQNTDIVLTRNDKFVSIKQEKIELDEIHFSTLNSSDKRYYALVDNKVDACDQVSGNDLGPLGREGFLYPLRDPFSLLYLGFNLAHPVLKDISVRRAIARAVDRGALIRYYLSGTSEALHLMPRLFRTSDDSLERLYKRDVDQAKSLLAASGYTGETIECYYPIDVSLPWIMSPQKVYSEMIGALLDIGLNIKPIPLNWSDYHARATEINTTRGILLGGFYGTYRDPYAFLGPVLAPLLVAQWIDAMGLNPVSHDTPEAKAHPTDSPIPSPSASAAPKDSSEAETSPTPSPSITPAKVEPAPTLEQIMSKIREADSATSLDEQREKYRSINQDLAAFMPAVPLLNVTSNIGINRRIIGYETEQSAIELFAKVRIS